MTYQGNSAANICNVSDFQRTTFKSVSRCCFKGLVGNYVESKNAFYVEVSFALK